VPGDRAEQTDEPDDRAGERMVVERTIAADPAAIFAVLRDPAGHVAIDSSGMLMSSSDAPVSGVGDRFVVHMNREALGDRPMGDYDVIVTIVAYEPDREIAWTVRGRDRPSAGHVFRYVLEPVENGTLVTSSSDWSGIAPAVKEAGIFPVLPETTLRATLGILARTVEGRGRVE
jgi:hypothetical protein